MNCSSSPTELVNLRGLPKDCGHTIKSVQGIDDHRNHGIEESDHRFWDGVQSEEDNKQRIKYEDRDRVIGCEQRVDNSARTRHGVEESSDHEACDQC